MNADSSLAKAVVEAQKPLVEQLSRIENSLRAIACAELTRTLYSPEELRELRGRCTQLITAFAQCQEAITRAQQEVMKDDSLSWEARIEKYGVVDATKQNAPVRAAVDARALADQAVSAFREEHPLVWELVKLGKPPKP